MKKQCIICHIVFDTPRSNKTCSEACYESHRKNRRENSDSNIIVTRECKFCGEPFKAKRYKPKAFCNRSCASKYYIKNGTYDKWRLMKIERQGFYGSCKVCKKSIYLEPRFKGLDSLVKLCGIECEKIHFASLFNGEQNPMYGKKLTIQQKNKQKSTLFERYGVTNAYFLAKRSTVSKPQRDLYNNLSELYRCKLETLLPFHSVRYFADIFIPDNNIVIEFMGNYWHCNPLMYKEDYWHKKKCQYARDVWESDKIRKETLEKLGYIVYYVWESDYTRDKETVIRTLKEKIDAYRTR
jgi:G:T-mismatch repair DNA endonuclease (very short patch repair protein)